MGAVSSRIKAKLGPRRDDGWGGWNRVVTLADGRIFFVSVKRGRFAPGMYGVRGFHWIGCVAYDEGKGWRVVWQGRVIKSIGARGLIEEAWMARKIELGGEAYEDAQVRDE